MLKFNPFYFIFSSFDNFKSTVYLNPVYSYPGNFDKTNLLPCEDCNKHFFARAYMDALFIFESCQNLLVFQNNQKENSKNVAHLAAGHRVKKVLQHLLMYTFASTETEIFRVGNYSLHTYTLPFRH